MMAHKDENWFEKYTEYGKFLSELLAMKVEENSCLMSLNAKKKKKKKTHHCGIVSFTVLYSEK